jgi:hypothetical protein
VPARRRGRLRRRGNVDARRFASYRKLLAELRGDEPIEDDPPEG